MYEDSIRKISRLKQEMKTDTMKVPVVFHVGDDLMPSDATLEQLESVASNDTVFHHIAAMADVHSKPGRKNATGTTVTSEHHILPQVNDSDPACGMRFVKTNLTENNITPEEIDILFQELVKTVPTKKFIGTRVSFDTVVDICRGGIRPLIDVLGIQTRNEETHCIEGGNFFGTEVSRQNIFNVIPKLFLWFATFRLGILGAAGNHFLDLMKVTGIEDEETAKKFGLKNGQYVFMVHCGSGILGQYTMYMYTAKKREHLSQAIMVELGKLLFRSPLKPVYNRIAKKIREYQFGAKKELFTYDGHGPEGEMYMAARNACSNFAHANRAVITHNISETIKHVLGRDPELELLYDMPHILVSEEEHYGKSIWVHRNGTSRAYGPARMAHHSLFAATGEPAFIPSSMSTEAFLCVGMDDNESSFYSCNHGAGKAKMKSDNFTPENKVALHEKLKDRGVRLYNGQSSKVIEQDSSHYKRIDNIIATVKDNGIVRPVARLMPVSIIMY